ncbi:MAG TPA: LytTR family DNA-binding domain-containing protein [Puia sp.]|jgi:DNA-binding LytR/AlgR family response regulator|nr:LytTR family DNA-binding domain-containing protein [Puia sp.]
MIRCIAVDDETPALDILEDNISRVPFLQLVKKCKNAYQAMEVLQQEPIDLLFLDIEMPGLSGLRLLKEMTEKPMVIFITAYRKYAADGYDLDVLDYLVKPVSFERFQRAANKALEYQELRQKEKIPPFPEYIFVQSEYKLTKVFVHEILYIEGLGNYIKLYLTGSSRPILSKLSMKAIGEKLPAGKYSRVHKSFIVMLDKISCVHNDSIMIGGTEIPLSRFYRDEFFKLIHNA